ncbi:MAG: hypothetical protein AB1420_15835 [Bacillota bacterium]
MKRNKYYNAHYEKTWAKAIENGSLTVKQVEKLRKEHIELMKRIEFERKLRENNGQATIEMFGRGTYICRGKGRAKK